jgi:uncharacterized protein (TIGR04255 family)
MVREQLPNSPLVEVSAEARFPGDLSVFAAWGEIQRELRSEFPKLYVPGSTPGVSPFLQHLKLASTDETDSVLLALNSLGFATQRYSTFSVYEASFQRVYEVFRKHVHPTSATRFGLRYRNVLPPVGADEISPGELHPALNLRLGGLEITGTAHAAQPQLVCERVCGELNVRIVVAAQPVATAEALGSRMSLPLAPGVALDLDCYRNGPGAMDQMPAFLRNAHEIIDDVFFGLITDRYLGYLKGES